MILNKKIILIGGSGHAQSIINLLIRKKLKKQIIGYVDNKKTDLNLEYIGNDQSLLKKFKPSKKVILVNCIGSDIKIRLKVFKFFKNNKYSFMSIIDNSSIISSSSVLHEGVVIFPNVVIGPNTVIERNTHVLSLSNIDHGTRIGKNCYFGPCSVICGDVSIGDNVFIGANSCVVENRLIADNCTLGASSLLIKDCKTKNSTLIGVPAKRK
tara:strand:+ start:2483 stop:3115 length:633 start_codon:yes stop_codon:yes gene_type:complete